MRAIPRILLICLLSCCGLACAMAETYTLEDGGTIVGDPLLSTASDAGVKIRLADDTYTNVSWGAFSQASLKEFAKDPKLTEYVDPFIIISVEDKARMTEVDITEPKRLSRPEKGSVIGSLFGSFPGWILVLALTGANMFAGYEIAIFRARNVLLVAGLAAIPFVGLVTNIVWLSLPTYMGPEEESTEAQHAELEAMQPDFKVPLGGEIEAVHAAAEGRDTAVPKDEIFPRGKFTFNKRFFETRFADFFGVVRRGQQKFAFMVIKTPKATVVADRVTRVTPTEVHVNVVKGGSGEMGVNFAEIQEIRLTVNA